MTDPRPYRDVVRDVTATIGHRCYWKSETNQACTLRDDGTSLTFSVVFDTQVDANWPLAYSMCNDCVTDVRRAMPNEIRQITTTQRAAR